MIKQSVKRLVRKSAHTIPPIGHILNDRAGLKRENEQLRNDVHVLTSRIQEDLRTIMSRRYVHGEGVEIGALHMPLKLAEDATAKYVDYIPVDELRRQYPELKKLNLVDVSLVDNAEKLTKVKNNSVDFIIANHFLEHCQDPIGTVVTFFSKLRGNGILYMAVPDKRYTFDMNRKITTYKHLEDEHKSFPAKKFLRAHCQEIATETEGAKNIKKIKERVKYLIDSNYSIHYHVWTQKELVEFFYKTAEKYDLNLEIEAIANNVHEVIFIIRKVDKKIESTKVKAIKQHYLNN